MTALEPGRPTPRPYGYAGRFGASAALFALGIVAILELVLFVVGIVTSLVWVGIPILISSLAMIKATSQAQRRIAAGILGVPGTKPHYRRPGRGANARIRDQLSDPVVLRDILYVPIAATLGFAIGITAFVGLLIVPVGLVISPILLRLNSSLALSVLRTGETERMTERIGELVASRAETVDSQAAEIRRIERDLHDGAQARLVALSMNLGLAEQLNQHDPAAATELITESRQSAVQALADLRELVRGIHPPVLADRGLSGAIEALALAHPIEVEVDSDLVGRPQAPVESAVYFAVSEVLTNAAKYSAATMIWIWVRHIDGVLRLSVSDDGHGGAAITSGGGLAGIAKRLAAFDGHLNVASPIGGPTVVTMDVPCELSGSR